MNISVTEYKKRRNELWDELKQLDYDFYKQFSDESEAYERKLKAIFTPTEEKFMLPDESIKIKTKTERGIPSKETQVVDWRIKNPRGTVKECFRETGIGINTIKKWWHSADVFMKTLKQATV